MHHPRQLHVGAEVLLRVHLRCNVGARNRLADDGVLFRVLGLGLPGSVEGIANLLVPLELDVEIAPADELGVGDLFRGVSFGLHDAVAHRKRIGRNAELLGRHLDQHAPRLGGRHAHLLAAELDPRRAGGAALVHAGRSVAHDHGDGLERHIELLRHHLSDGDEQPLPHVHLSEERRHAAVSIDGDIRGQLIRGERGLCSLCDRIADLEHGRKPDRHADRDDERSAGLKHGAAREMRGFFDPAHGLLPQPIISTARLTARRMPIWVPQRHLRPVSASLISASLGFFFRSRNAAAVMIQPLMQ